MVIIKPKTLTKKRQETLEAAGWLVLAEQSLKEVWDNEEDESVWKDYL